MKKLFKPIIKHDEVTQTYTIRDKKGVVIQVPDVIIDRLDTYYNTLETQKKAFQRSYKQVYEENEELRRENEELKLKVEEYYESWQDELMRSDDYEDI